MRAAAEKALKGTAAQMRHFLEVVWQQEQYTDDQVRVSQIHNMRRRRREA